jgi:hypothetical protein
MENLNRTTPPVTARSKNSSSSINSSHAASGAHQSSSMAPSARTTRGSTPTASRSASKLVDDATAARPASRDSLKQKMLKKPDEAPRPSRAEEVQTPLHWHNASEKDSANRPQQLNSLKTDFDSLRTHLTCKICDRLLYQPYTISCGHTYCYTVRQATRKPKQATANRT